MMVRATYLNHFRCSKPHSCPTPFRNASRNLPNRHSFMALLRECSLHKDIHEGVRIHVEISRFGLLEGDIFLGSILVDMYAKCGFLVKAQEVFDHLPFRDVVIWTTLIGGYVGYGLCEKAFECVEKMQQEGIAPDSFTFVCILKVCGNSGAMEKGEGIHCEIIRKGLLENNFFLGSMLVDMYVKFGALVTARKVFDKVQKRDVAVWNALVGGYAEQGCCEEAFTCLFQMHDEGISPNAITFVSILKACGGAKWLLSGQQIHMQIIGRGLENDVFIRSTLIDMYAKCGLLLEAQNLFGSVLVHDIVVWNVLIMGYTENDHGEEALEVLEQMQENGISADDVTYLCSLKACGIIGSTSKGQNKGQEIHVEIVKKGFDRDPLIGSTLVDMYIKCDSLLEAQEVFDKLPSQDVVSSTLLISGFNKLGESEGALYCFEKTKKDGILSNVVSLICTLKACGNMVSTFTGSKIHGDIIRKGLEREAVIGNSLVSMYAKCGLLVEAQNVFDNLPVRDIMSWNALLIGYGNVGESKSVFYIFNKLIGEYMKPCSITLLNLLNVCNHVGLLHDGLIYFEMIGNDYNLDITIDHYACIADLFARAGYKNIAIDIVENMPLHPDIAMWHMLLSACWRVSDVELGREVFGHVIELDEEDISSYVCMSNIYADVAMQEEANKIKLFESIKSKH